ncbi:endothelin-converting enzyme homolog [Musca autumnalis]|uniref:endothelin-converting enzyme homolog n=1 Tax=Musca autumnalis TaxID=221902 RepID=UPI003CF87C46
MGLRRIFFTLLLISYHRQLLCEATSVQMTNFVNRRQQKLIEGSMDMEVDPCEDFYQYACGKWSEYVDGAGYQFAETLSMMDYRANKDFMDYMNKLPIRNGPRYARKAYEFYKSCLNVQLYEPQMYLKWLAENEGIRWASIFSSGKDAEVYDWVSTLAILWKYGMNGIFIELTSFYPKEDPSKLMIDVDKPLLSTNGIGFEPLTYRNLREIIRSLDGVMKPKDFAQFWPKISKFEEKLLEMKEDINDPRGTENITLKELPLEWLEKYLHVALNQTISDNQINLYIQNIPYLEALDEELKLCDSEFISQYLQIRFLWHMRKQRPPIFTAEGCIVPTRGLLALAMHWIYEQQKPQIEEEIPGIQKIFENIKKQFKVALQRNEKGFPPTSQQFLMDKLDQLQLKVGNLPRWNTVAILEDHYKNLSLSVSDFYGNHLKLLAYDVNNKKFFYKLSNASNYFHLEEYDTATSPSPYFIHKANMVVLPSSAVQRPLYHPGHEDLYKYSSMGFLLAHEMLHAFDINGLEMDSMGKLNSSQYENILSNSKFDKQLQCLRRLNPMVINEKLSDISGLQYAYETFFSEHMDAENRTRLIFRQEMPFPKLFFLNFAQFFCGSSSSFYFVNVNEHGNDRDRVNDAVANFPEFTKVFKCSQESRLQANQSCNLWRR